MSVEMGSGIGMGAAVASAPAVSASAFSAGIEAASSITQPTVSTPLTAEISGGSFQPSLSAELHAMPKLSAMDISTTDRGIPGREAFAHTLPFEISRPETVSFPKIETITIPAPREANAMNMTKPFVLDTIQTIDQSAPPDFSMTTSEPLVISTLSQALRDGEKIQTEALIGEPNELYNTISYGRETSEISDTFQESEVPSLADMLVLAANPNMPTAHASVRENRTSEEQTFSSVAIQSAFEPVLPEAVEQTVHNKLDVITQTMSSDPEVAQLYDAYEAKYVQQNTTSEKAILQRVSVKPELQIMPEPSVTGETQESEVESTTVKEQTIAVPIEYFEQTEEESEEEKRRKKVRLHPEIIADTVQAVKVQRVLESLGVPKTEAQQQALRSLHTAREQRAQFVSAVTDTQTATQPVSEQIVKPETKQQQQVVIQETVEKQEEVLVEEKEKVTEEEKRPKLQVEMEKNTKKVIFEEDPVADQNRFDLGLAATRVALEQNQEIPYTTLTGSHIAALMPDAPQPVGVKSDLLLKMFDGIEFPDGSYEEVIGRIAKTGEIYSASHAENVVADAIKQAPAVRVNETVVTRKVTDKDVKRVLDGRINSIVKDVFSL
jgi:hypothetical protein